ncbi:MAG: pyridoxamine 5'-phosphate oxidase family protein [Dehalococcoidia bacterium]|nr:pyridoxamine 5'-phosphate oxidase family protein [Dehalococcoidia bacterium]
MRWIEFEEDAPELAGLVRQRFDATELVMMGTLRPNGWPRISPIEFTYWDGDFVLGGMWQSKKFQDVMRDNRVTLHSTTTNKNGQEGDVKIYGRVHPLAEERIEPYWQHIFTLLNWRPAGPAHVYTLDVEEGSYARFEADGTMRWLTWPGNEWHTQKAGG